MSPHVTLEDLRRYAVARSFFGPTTLKRALHEFGFVQADPIRAPARAQDLTLRFAYAQTIARPRYQQMTPYVALDDRSGAGLVASNPPYGVRVGETTGLRDLYARLGDVLRARRSGWQLALLSAAGFVSPALAQDPAAAGLDDPLLAQHRRHPRGSVVEL